MKSIRAFITTRAVVSYFVLTFLISWGGVLMMVGRGIPGTAEETTRLFFAVYLVTIAGPSVASILLTGLIDGKAGLCGLRSRLLRWRVSAGWYAAAVLTAPITVMAALLILSLTSPRFTPGLFTMSIGEILRRFGFLAGIGLLTGFMEELGWTGFVIPRLTPRYGVFKTGLLVGIMWGAWHFVSNLWGSESAAGLSLWLFLPVILFSFLPPYRMLMVWVYSRTGSLLVAMLMHASLVSFWLISMPQGIVGAPLVAWYLVWAVVLWIIVALLAFTKQLAGRVYSTQAEPTGLPESGGKA